jgi:hypothetical protein
MYVQQSGGEWRAGVAFAAAARANKIKAVHVALERTKQEALQLIISGIQDALAEVR